MKSLLTDSRLRTFRRCPREEKFRYQLGYQSAASDAQRFGTLIHTALEAWWKASSDRLQAALAALTECADPFDRAKADALITGYDARWSEQPYTALAVEHPFRLPLINPTTGAPSRTWDLAGKMDALVTDENGDVYVCEHKTTSQDCAPGSNYMTRLRLDSQVSMYLRAARELGHEPRGVLYDVIKKPGLRPLQANKKRAVAETPEEYRDRIIADICEDPDKYFQRAKVVRLASEIEEFERELWQLGETMRDFAREGVAPRNTDGCERYGQKCSFFSVCVGEASLDDDQLFTKVADANPELATDKAA